MCGCTLDGELCPYHAEQRRRELEGLSRVLVTAADRLAELLVERLELATVARIPRAVVESLQDGSSQYLRLFDTAPAHGELRLFRAGDVLELEFLIDGRRNGLLRLQAV